MQSFALSVMTETQDGRLGHVLYLVEACDAGAAEARVLGRLTAEGFLIRGVLSHSTTLAGDALASAA